jgi:hypothetical protein
MGAWGYLLLAVPLAIYEIYAIVTNKYDTISEIIWKVGKIHWVFRLLTLAFCIWLTIHLMNIKNQEVYELYFPFIVSN